MALPGEVETESLIGMLRSLGPNVISALVIFCIGWVVATWAARSVRSVTRRSARFDATLVPVLASVTRMTLLTIAAMAALEKLGVDTKSLFAVIGTAGLTIGLALKDTLSDVASGIVLLVLRPFDVGDAVEIDATEGVVDAIDIFQTKLTSFDGVPVSLPNSRVRAARIQNYSRAQRRRMDLTIGVGHGTDIAHAMSIIEDLLTSEPRVLREPAPSVDVTEVGDQKVSVLVRAWMLPDDFLAARLELTRHLKERLAAEGISIAMPQRELHLAPRPRLRSSSPPHLPRISPR